MGCSGYMSAPSNIALLGKERYMVLSIVFPVTATRVIVRGRRDRKHHRHHNTNKAKTMNLFI